MRVAAKSLGCKVNLAETEAVLGELRDVEPVEKGAELVFINTCAVTTTAEAKTRAEIRRARRENPDALLVVSGCFVSRDPETARALGADLVVPNAEKPQIAALIREALGERVDPLAAPPEALWGSPERYLLNSRVRAFLKVQDGCNAGCAYCVIPRLRGRERSRPAEDALKEAETLLEKGVREIVLTGVRLGSYSGHERGLSGLVEDLAALGAFVRLSSIEPEDTDERLIEAIARHAPQVRPHLHLSLQTGSERLLELMNRRYSLEDYKRIVALAHEKIPDFALTTDVIAGLPTETEEDFEATLKVLEELKPARVHVFTYTPRPGTRAARLPQVPHPEKKARTRRLIALATRLAEARIRPKIGKTTTLLVERAEAGVLKGHTPDYYEAEVRGEARPGETVSFVIEGARGYTLTGRRVS